MDNLDIVFWAVLAVLAFVGELLTVSFFLLFLSLGALAGLALAALNFGIAVQAVGFVAASALSMTILRPALMHRISFRGSERYESRNAVTGRSGVVTDAIEPGGSGMVRIGSGDFWTARSVYPEQGIEAGTRVRVLDTDGVTALVEAVGIEEGEKS
jgi:membrane protein implicated in regulation of membrane protease activity